MPTFNNNDKKITNLILFITGLLILSYTVIRASMLSITSDESHTFIEYMNKGIIFLSSYDRASANDHFLNTWLMEIITQFFGISELSIRLPNLIAHLFFLIYSAKLLSKFSSKILIVSSFLILNLNPFLLDFFMLARGYGIAIGLMMISLYYGYLFIVEKRSYLIAFVSILLSAFAVLASFTLIGFMLVNMGILIVINSYRVMSEIKENKIRSEATIIKEFIILFLPLVIFLFVVPVIINMKHSTALFWGGTTGFWKDSVFSLITQTMYGHHFMNKLRNGIQIGVAIVLSTSFVMILMNYIKTKSIKRYSYLAYLFIILFSCFLMNFLEYQLLGILYLQERTALFYFPLFILLMAFLFDDLINKNKKIFQGIIIGIAILFTFNFFVNINFHHVKSWKKEADTKDMIKDIIDYKNTNYNSYKPIALSVFKWSWLYDNDICYYKQKYHLDWLKFTNYYYYKDSSDIVLLDKSDVDSLNNPSLKLLMDYPCSNMVLFYRDKK